MGRVAGKVALITGAARGQGRSHAVALAAEGADIVAVDLCADIASVPYPLGTEADLAETERLVEKLDRRILAVRADVRDSDAMRDAVDRGLREFGRLDVVVAQAGVAPMGTDQPVRAMLDTVDVNLVGVLNTLHAAVPKLDAGASIIATGSLAAMRPRSGSADPASAGYKFAKQALAHYVHELATALAPLHIRVNAVHPTNTDTQMLHHEGMYRLFRPDLDAPTREQAEAAFPVMNAMPVPYVQPEDISHAVVYLASDESRFVTGMQLRIDAGGYLKVHPYTV
ncbi:MAG TPA: mycofactocin-coupled SDR family oxidoreductase [Pseudonocardia sp.]|uniref:mycofactocin-coupled SDR family oxidoreductase n=1 Tax=Pseudonocardia sp. TaxID=60912 RepID=UPI002BFAA646|nr:mycofactocin-coupled SDR family oxidoreductase [Pseudonocardia sp.]HTF54274.1 mycofactocin-coupled SDR family oxidoreductase [Pseudonocardia sp.]